MSEGDRHCEYCLYWQCERRSGDPGKDYVGAMRRVVGTGFVGGSRETSSRWARYLVAYRMHKDGFPPEEIGRRLGRDRTSVYRMVDRAEEAFGMPFLYKEEMDLWERFSEELAKS